MNLIELVRDIEFGGAGLDGIRDHYDSLLCDSDNPKQLDILLSEFPYLDRRSKQVLKMNLHLDWPDKPSGRHGYSHHLASLHLLSILMEEEKGQPIFQKVARKILSHSTYRDAFNSNPEQFLSFRRDAGELQGEIFSEEFDEMILHTFPVLDIRAHDRIGRKLANKVARMQQIKNFGEPESAVAYVIEQLEHTLDVNYLEKKCGYYPKKDVLRRIAFCYYSLAGLSDNLDYTFFTQVFDLLDLFSNTFELNINQGLTKNDPGLVRPCERVTMALDRLKCDLGEIPSKNKYRIPNGIMRHFTNSEYLLQRYG